MAVQSQLWPLKSANREIVELLARFEPDDTNAPVNVVGRGVEVTRTDVGEYEITFPTTIDADSLYGLEVTIIQTGTNYELRPSISAGGGIALAAVDPEAGTAYDPVELDGETIFVCARVKNTKY